MSYHSVDWMRSRAPAVFRGETRNQSSLADIAAPVSPPSHGDLLPVESFSSLSTPQTWFGRNVGKFLYSSGWDSSVESILGSLHIYSRLQLFESFDEDDCTIRYHEDQREYRTSLSVSPATWLASLGIKYGFRIDLLKSATRGWQSNLKIFCRVPDDAPIFEFCRKGNLPAVRTLLSKGHASVRDTDSSGRTPLHVSKITMICVAVDAPVPKAEE